MVSTRTKFGIPFSGPNTRGGMLALKMKYRFRVLFTNFGPNTAAFELSRQVQSCGLPSVNYAKGQVHAYNSIAYYAGKHTWQPISLVIKDDITNQATRYVGHQVQKQLNHLEQTGYPAGMNYKFDMAIETLDGGNTEVIDRWELEGCWLEDVKYGDLDYTSMSDFRTIDMTIQYDNAVMVSPDGMFPQNPYRADGSLI